MDGHGGRIVGWRRSSNLGEGTRYLAPEWKKRKISGTVKNSLSDECPRKEDSHHGGPDLRNISLRLDAAKYFIHPDSRRNASLSVRNCPRKLKNTDFSRKNGAMIHIMSTVVLITIMIKTLTNPIIYATRLVFFFTKMSSSKVWIEINAAINWPQSLGKKRRLEGKL